MTKRISVGFLFALLFAQCVLRLHPALAQTNSANLASTTGSIQLAKSLTLSFPANPASNNTIVVMVAYTNAANTGGLTVSGLGATWANFYAPSFQAGMGVTFFSGTTPSGSQSLITVNAAQPDNLVVVAQAWSNLSGTVDPASMSLASGTSQNPAVTVNTSNSNDVIFNIVGYLGTALPSPPSAGFLDLGLVPTGQFPPNVTGGFGIVNAAGTYTNTFSTSASVPWLSAAVALESTSSNATFAQIPLTDFALGSTYLGAYPGFLYDNSNTPDANHDTNGRTAAAAVMPLDSSGTVAPDGKIGWVGIGGSNLTGELCTNDFILPRNATQCDPNTFFDQANKLPNINPSLALADCASTGSTINNWLNLASGAWTTCVGTRLPAYGLTPAQVEIVTIDLDDGLSSSPTLSGSACPSAPVAGTDPDACVYESNLASVVRLLRVQFPNLQQIFLESRPYCGYGASEPLCYENGLAVKWLLQSQADQVEGISVAAGQNDSLPGDLSYGATGWMAWGPYTWGSGTTPRLDGQTSPPDNFEDDGATTSQCQFYGISCGRQHDANLMMAFYSTSPYTTPWFLTTPSTYKLTVSPASHNFGKLDVGQVGATAKAKTFTVRNPSGSKRPTITIGTATATGDTFGNYQITGGTCATGLELAPGKSCTINTNFTPLALGNSTGVLTIPNNGGAVMTVALKGTGRLAEITVSPKTISFAKTSVGQSSKTKTITLKNNEILPLTVAPFILGGLNPGDFSETSLCPLTLTAKSSCTISVTFTPTATGSRKATIPIVASLDSVNVTLSGSGK